MHTFHESLADVAVMLRVVSSTGVGISGTRSGWGKLSLDKTIEFIYSRSA
jgi:hypothetical protein